jgi:hypothetical protein
MTALGIGHTQLQWAKAGPTLSPLGVLQAASQYTLRYTW